MLLEPEHKKKALDVIHAGKEYVEHMVRETSEHFCELIHDSVYMMRCFYDVRVMFNCSDGPKEEAVEERWETLGCG